MIDNMYYTKQGQTWDGISLELFDSEYYVSELMSENPQYINVAIFDGTEVLKIPELVDVADTQFGMEVAVDDISE